MAAARTPEEIRAGVEETRRDLTYSLNDLQGKIAEVTNWRLQLQRNKRAAIIGAAAAGFVLGGGVAGVFGLFRRGS
jgi:hypothetical protein